MGVQGSVGGAGRTRAAWGVRFGTRARAAQFRALPEAVRRLRDPARYPVAYSDRLEALKVRGPS